MKNDHEMLIVRFMERGIQSLEASRGFFNAAGCDVEVEHITFWIAAARAELDEYIERTFKKAIVERRSK